MPSEILAQRIRIEIHIPYCNAALAEYEGNKIVEAMENLDLRLIVNNWLSAEYKGEFRVTVTGQ